MRRLLLMLTMLLGFTLPAIAGSVTLQWGPATGATGYEIEQSVDGGTVYTRVADLTATAACGTATICTHTLTAPSTGHVFFRFISKNSNGKTTRAGEGVWHCESCKPPVPPANVGVQ